MADFQQRVAENIVEARERKGYGREELALKAHVSPKQLRRIERGQSDPRPSTVRKIAKALKVDYTDLRPDLDAHDDRLDRIEAIVTALAEEAGIDVSEPALAARAAARAGQANGSGASESPGEPDASAS